MRSHRYVPLKPFNNRFKLPSLRDSYANFILIARLWTIVRSIFSAVSSQRGHYYTADFTPAFRHHLVNTTKQFQKRANFTAIVSQAKEKKVRRFSTRRNTRDGVQEQREESGREVRRARSNPKARGNPENPSGVECHRERPQQAKTALLPKEETKEKEKEKGEKKKETRGMERCNS